MNRTVNYSGFSDMFLDAMHRRIADRNRSPHTSSAMPTSRPAGRRRVARDGAAGSPLTEYTPDNPAATR